VSFEAGVFSSGAYFPSGNRLLYSSSGNISGAEGTLEFWFKPRWGGNDGLDHCVLRVGGAGGMLFGKDGGNFWRMILNRFGAGGNPELGAGLNLGTEVMPNQWHHCAFTWSAYALKVYVDGAVRAQTTPTFPPPAVADPSLQIGADDFSAPADAVLDELRISDRARTASEIQHSYEAGLPLPSLPAPTNLTITPFHTTSLVRWDPVVNPALAGYRIERRTGGGAFEIIQRVNARSSYNDYGLVPGISYDYRVAAINGAGVAISAYTIPASTQTDPDPFHYSRHKSFETLVALYQSGYSAAEIDGMVAGLKTSMEFYWRTTRGRFLFDPTWVQIDAALPSPQWDATIESDLRSRGVANDQYDLAYLIGNGLAGCFGGYVVLGSTCASLGTVCGVAYPGNDPAVNYTIAWTFTHEIHHALETMEDITSGTPNVLFCHFPWCYPDPLGPTGYHMDWGTHYDGIAATNRQYADNWSLFPPPYDGYIECRDADQDGFPDADSRVPMDEARFGSSPSLRDTDGDGLDDLAEYCRYNFRGSDPLKADTDGDGLRDGLDEEPLYALPPGIRATSTPLVIDGVLEPRWPLMTGYYFTKNATPFTLRTYAAWDGNALYLAFSASRRLRFMVSIDGSGQDGRFESPVRYITGATDTDNLDNKANHIGDTWGDGNHILFAHGVSGADVFGRGPIAGAEVSSSVSDGTYITEAKIPATLPAGAAYTWYPPGPQTPAVTGLRLTPDRVLGLNVTMSNFEDSDGSEFSGTWTSLFETHSYVDLTLLGWPVDVAVEPVPFVAGISMSNPYLHDAPIRVAAAAAATTRVDLYDVIGRHVRALHSGSFPAGGLSISWNGRNDGGRGVASGVYYIRAEIGRSHYSRKFTFLR